LIASCLNSSVYVRYFLLISGPPHKRDYSLL
jgi:hypothetical protein